MRKILWIVWLLLGPIPVLSQEEKDVDLEALYKQIDKAIEESPLYVQAKEEEIKETYDLFMKAKNAENRLEIAEQLFWLYKPFKNDSAIHYAQLIVDLAKEVNRLAVSNRYRALLARQCSNAGMYVEASGILQKTDKTALDRQGLTDYFDACMHVCGEVAAYTLIPQIRDYYYAEQDHYRDSLLTVVDPASDNYLHLQMSALCARQQYQEALKVSDKWLNKTVSGTHEDAYAAYYRHIVYANIGNEKMVRYWLGKSAFDDVSCAVMDQAALINLAQLLNIDGDLDRSYRYIRFTWQCNSFFNTRMRANQISPVLNVIEKNYQDAIDRNTKLLYIIATIGAILAIVFFSLLTILLKQKKKLALAQQEVKKKNEELEASNHKLKWMNERVMKNNKQLFEINARLQEEKNGILDNSIPDQS